VDEYMVQTAYDFLIRVVLDMFGSGCS
jgi:hypothetical protein